jgi:hypothetical protein
VRALDYCGWCSVPVLYNGTIKGTNCAGLNKTLNPGSMRRMGFWTEMDLSLDFVFVLVAVSILVLELDFFALNSVCCPFSH